MTTDEFRKLSALAAILIPHDEAELTLWSNGEPPVRLFMSARDTDPNDREESSAPVEVARLVTDEEARPYGLAAGVRAPLRGTGDTQGFLTLLSHRPRAYDDDTLPAGSDAR